MFCQPADREVLSVLLTDLPGLQPILDLHLGDSAAFAQRARDLALDTRFALHFDRDQLFLCRADNRGSFAADRASLNSDELGRRSGKPTELQRACFGGLGGQNLRVLDAFAGWGLDGLSLARAGAQVSCVELQPLLVALLRDACRRVSIAQGSVSVVCGSAWDVLAAPKERESERQSETFDVVYLDPMFPARRKGALPNKRLQWLAELCADIDTDLQLDSPALLQIVQLARRKAGRSVVLKRRRKDAVVGQPQRQVLGSAVRYDIYPAMAG